MTAERPTLARLAADLASGAVSAADLTGACLDSIGAEDGQGRTAFVHVDRAGARIAAKAVDKMRESGAALSPFAGIPIAIKDLFDVAGQVTRAGSKVLNGPPARADAVAVRRLRQAGFILIGRSNMTEFAFSGLGLNPHYGTPLSPWRRNEKRISGGSTSGGAAAVADGMAHAALGTDTGGSCRIPAAWCGLVGFKPTAARIAREGVTPLSTTLDSVGSIARSVDCIAAFDAILTGKAPKELMSRDLTGMRFARIENIVCDGADKSVVQAYERALGAIKKSGARITKVSLEPFDRIAAINAKGGFAAAESFAWHRRLLETREAEYDPRVASRIKRGSGQSAADYIDLLAARAALMSDAADALDSYDAMLMPTTPIAPPLLADLADDEAYGRINLLALRNPTLINMIDGCAVSLPMHWPGDAPAGLMIACLCGQDRKLLALAKAVESALSGAARS